MQKLPVHSASFVVDEGGSNEVVGILHTADEKPYADSFSHFLVGSQRYPRGDVPGVQAWIGDKGLVYADGPDGAFSFIMECTADSFKVGPGDCLASDHGFAGPHLLEIMFPTAKKAAARSVIRQVENVAALVEVNCPGGSKSKPPLFTDAPRNQ